MSFEYCFFSALQLPVIRRYDSLFPIWTIQMYIYAEKGESSRGKQKVYGERRKMAEHIWGNTHGFDRDKRFVSIIQIYRIEKKELNETRFRLRY